jgi:hypothetical protein
MLAERWKLRKSRTPAGKFRKNPVGVPPSAHAGAKAKRHGQPNRLRKKLFAELFFCMVSKVVTE